MKSGAITIRHVSKEFRSLRRSVVALRSIDLKIEEGEFYVILGPSGCGKSTLLNILAGLEKPSRGTIMFGDKRVVDVDSRLFVSPRERNVAMVFQSYALYPHLNVYENIAFPLRIAKVAHAEIEKNVKSVADLLDIGNLLHARPRELSGGQRQRVAMARALVRHPAIFLLDEPLSNLDAQLRVRLREELKNLQRRLGITTVYVTHDQAEAMTLGDRIAIIRDGEIQQIGQPMQVYKNPANTFVARFIGVPPMNLIPARIARQDAAFVVSLDDIRLTAGGLAEKRLQALEHSEIIAGIRAEDILIGCEGDDLQRRITFVERLGSESILYVLIGDEKIQVKVFEECSFKEGETISLRIPPEKVYIFNKEGDMITRLRESGE